MLDYVRFVLISYSLIRLFRVGYYTAKEEYGTFFNSLVSFVLLAYAAYCSFFLTQI